MVFIPDADRGTLCVSSQVGCTLNCRFCHTVHDAAGAQPDRRRDRRSGDAGARFARRMAIVAGEGRMLTNIVMMGMGEPLYNFDNGPRRAAASSWMATGLGLSEAADHAVSTSGRSCR